MKMTRSVYLRYTRCKPPGSSQEHETLPAAREDQHTASTRSHSALKKNISPKQTSAKVNIVKLNSTKDEEFSKVKSSEDDSYPKKDSTPTNKALKKNVTPKQKSTKKAEGKYGKENIIPKQKTIKNNSYVNPKSSMESVGPKQKLSLYLDSEHINKDVLENDNKGLVDDSPRFLRSVTSDRNITFNKSNVDRSVLCDKTNSNVLCTKPKAKNVSVQKTVTVKNNIAFSPPKPIKKLTEKENNINKNHVPIYKPENCVTLSNKLLPPERIEEVYEFEVDETEEPCQPKKKKKRAYTRKPKIGPKALTINNIKYSSSESLVSLPERPVKRTKRPKKAAAVKLYSSVTNLIENEDTCSSVSSFMSHPSSLLLCGNNKSKPKKKLSVLQETQSELTHES